MAYRHAICMTPNSEKQPKGEKTRVMVNDLKEKVENLAEDDKQYISDFIDIINTGVPYKELQHFREFIEQEGIDKAIEAKAEELRKLQLRKEELKKRMTE